MIHTSLHSECAPQSLQPCARPHGSVRRRNDIVPTVSPRSFYLEMQLQSRCFVLLNYLLESSGFYLGTSSGKLDGPWLWAWTRSPIFSFRNDQAIDNRNLYIFFWLPWAACAILGPWPGIEPGPSAVKVPSPNHWTSRKFPKVSILNPIGVSWALLAL